MKNTQDGANSWSHGRGSALALQRHDWNGDCVLSGNEVRVGAARDPGKRVRLRIEHCWTGGTGPSVSFTNLDRNRDGRIALGPERVHDREGFAPRGLPQRGKHAHPRGVPERRRRRGSRRPLRHVDAEPGTAASNKWHASRDAFTWLDRNRDGVLSRAEATSATTRGLGRGPARANNDGMIPTAAVAVVATHTRLAGDQNGDGELTRAELTTRGSARPAQALARAVSGASRMNPALTCGRESRLGRRGHRGTPRRHPVDSGDRHVAAQHQCVRRGRPGRLADPTGARRHRRCPMNPRWRRSAAPPTRPRWSLRPVPQSVTAQRDRPPLPGRQRRLLR